MAYCDSKIPKVSLLHCVTARRACSQLGNYERLGMMSSFRMFAIELLHVLRPTL